MRARISQRSVEAAKPDAKPYEIRDTSLPGFMCRVQPSGRKSYVVEYARGRRITIGNAEVLTPEQGRNKAKKILGQAAEGIDPAVAKRKANANTLEAFIEQEYRPWAKAHRKHGDVWCDQILRVFADLTDTSLSDITAHKIDRIRTSRLNDGVSPATVNRNVTCLRGALSHAVQAGHLGEHPLAELKDIDVDSSEKVRYLSTDEAKALRTALACRDGEIREARNRANAWREQRHKPQMPAIPLDGFGDYMTPLVLLSLNTGARRGEMFNLEWSDVNFDLQQITIRGATSKRNRTRHIPLNAEALDMLKRWRQQCDGQGLVFKGRDGGRIDNVRKAWAGLLKDAGIEAFRWHDLRHTFASWLVMRGVDLNTVRELLGHGDIAMTLRYAHLAPEHKAEAVARLV